MIIEIPGLTGDWPSWFSPSANGVPAFSGANSTIDAAAEKYAVIFEAPKSGTIDLVEFLTRAVTFGGGSVLRVSLQSVAGADGHPSGTPAQWRDMTGVVANTWHATGLVTSDGTDGGAKRTVTATEILAVVWEFQTFSAGDSVVVGALNQSVGLEQADYPYTDLLTGGWVKSAAQAPCLALKYSDGSYAIPTGCFPISAVADNAYTSGSTPDERGFVFQTPAPLRIRAVKHRSSFAAGADADVVIYDASGTALRTASRDGDIATATGITGRFRSIAPLDLAANVNYRAVLKPTTANTTSLIQFTFPSAAIANAFCGGSTWQYTQRTDGGAWTDTATALPMMALVVCGVDDGAGQPIIISHRIVR